MKPIISAQQERVNILLTYGYEHVSGIIGRTPTVVMVKRTADRRYNARITQTGAVQHY